MKKTLLYIDDTLADLSGDIQPGIVVQKLDVGDITGRHINRSNSFTIPFSEVNDKIFGFAKEERSETTKPYNKRTCRFLSDGTQIRNMNICLLSSVEEDGYNITLYEDSYDLFSDLKNKSLGDIEALTSSAWNAAAIDSARTNTEGIVTVVLDWGKSGAIYQYAYFLPCFYYHSIVKTILQFTGLTLSGNILTDARFTDLVMPYWGTGFVYDSRFDYLEMFTQTSSQSLGITDPGGDFSGIIVDIDDNTSYGASNLVSNKYVIDSGGGGVNLTIVVIVDFDIVDWGDGSFARAIIAVNDADSGQGYTVTNPSTSSGVQTITLTDDFSDGDEIHVSFDTDASSLEVGLTTSASMRVTVNETVNRDSVNWNALLGDLSCTDIITDFFNRFAIVHKVVNGVLYLKTLEEIISNRAGAIDWSSKLIRTEPNIKFDTNYARNNYFEYEDSEDNKDPELGRGTLAISSDRLDSDKTIFKSIFQKSEHVVTGTYGTAKIPVFDASSASIEDFVQDQPGIRLLTIKARTDETAITFDALSRTDYKLGYFVDQAEDKDTGFTYFLGQFFPSFTAALNKNKLVTKRFIFDSVDIDQYDPHKLIWDGEGYYIVNKIGSFVAGVETKVELFKV